MYVRVQHFRAEYLPYLFRTLTELVNTNNDALYPTAEWPVWKRKFFKRSES